jgi:hypothetical protein
LYVDVKKREQEEKKKRKASLSSWRFLHYEAGRRRRGTVSFQTASRKEHNTKHQENQENGTDAHASMWVEASNTVPRIPQLFFAVFAGGYPKLPSGRISDVDVLSRVLPVMVT